MAAQSTVGTLAPTLPEEAALAATSKGLPPPPKASGFAESVRWASDVKTVATPLFAAVVGWKDGAGSSVAAAAVDSEDEEDVVVEVVVVSGDEVRVEDDADADDDSDVEVAELSPPVDEGAGPFPSTLFGHKYIMPF